MQATEKNLNILKNRKEKLATQRKPNKVIFKYKQATCKGIIFVVEKSLLENVQNLQILLIQYLSLIHI